MREVVVVGGWGGGPNQSSVSLGGCGCARARSKCSAAGAASEPAGGEPLGAALQTVCAKPGQTTKKKPAGRQPHLPHPQCAGPVVSITSPRAASCACHRARSSAYSARRRSRRTFTSSSLALLRSRSMLWGASVGEGEVSVIARRGEEGALWAQAKARTPAAQPSPPWRLPPGSPRLAQTKTSPQPGAAQAPPPASGAQPRRWPSSCARAPMARTRTSPV